MPLELKALAVLKKPARDLPARVIRSAARTEASKGIKLQRDEFKDFGLLGEWDEGAGYWTMAWEYEKRQLGVVRDMVGKGTTRYFFRAVSQDLKRMRVMFRIDHESSSTHALLTIIKNGIG